MTIKECKTNFVLKNKFLSYECVLLITVFKYQNSFLHFKFRNYLVHKSNLNRTEFANAQVLLLFWQICFRSTRVCAVFFSNMYCLENCRFDSVDLKGLKPSYEFKRKEKSHFHSFTFRYKVYYNFLCLP